MHTSTCTQAPPVHTRRDTHARTHARIPLHAHPPTLGGNYPVCKRSERASTFSSRGISNWPSCCAVLHCAGDRPWPARPAGSRSTWTGRCSGWTAFWPRWGPPAFPAHRCPELLHPTPPSPPVPTQLPLLPSSSSHLLQVLCALTPDPLPPPHLPHHHHHHHHHHPTLPPQSWTHLLTDTSGLFPATSALLSYLHPPHSLSPITLTPHPISLPSPPTTTTTTTIFLRARPLSSFCHGVVSVLVAYVCVFVGVGWWWRG